MDTSEGKCLLIKGKVLKKVKYLQEKYRETKCLNFHSLLTGVNTLTSIINREYDFVYKIKFSGCGLCHKSGILENSLRELICVKTSDVCENLKSGRFPPKAAVENYLKSADCHPEWDGVYRHPVDGPRRTKS